MIRLRRLLTVIAGLLMMAACVSTKIQSNRAEDYAQQPKRLFVITNIGTDFGSEYAEAFRGALTRIAKACGAEVEMSILAPLELDESVHDQKRKAFNADTVLSVRRAGGTRDAYGLLNVNYDSRLINLATNKTVWRSSMTFHRNRLVAIEKRGEALAVDLTNKMKDDRIFGSCPRIE